MQETVRKIYTFTVPVLAAFAALTAAVWGRAQAKRADMNERMAEEYINNYVSACVRCGRELSDSVSDMELSLDKLRVTSSVSGRVLALEDIARESASAVQLLCRLPRSQIDAMAEEEFLTRAGDYARYLSRRLLGGTEPSEKEVEQLEAMLEACSAYSKRLSERVENGEMPVGTEEFDYYEASAEDGEQLDFPALVYDGPFAEALEKAEPKGLTGREYGAEEALQRARELIGDTAEPAGRTEGRLPAWDFSGEGGDVSLTVTGLHVLHLMKTPKGDAEGVPDEAEYERLSEAGKSFLAALGYGDMEPVYSSFSGGTAMISYVWRHGETRVWSDVIKVWIDRETGEPCGLDAEAYLFNHGEREWSEPLISAEEARKAVSAQLEITETGLALIPLTPMTETLCYELHGSLEDREYVVCVNAETGAEEKIIKILRDENGTRPDA